MGGWVGGEPERGRFVVLREITDYMGLLPGAWFFSIIRDKERGGRGGNRLPGKGKERGSKAGKRKEEGRAVWHFEFIWLLLRSLGFLGLLHQNRHGLWDPTIHLRSLLSVGVPELTTISYLSLYLSRGRVHGVSKTDVSESAAVGSSFHHVMRSKLVTTAPAAPPLKMPPKKTEPRKALLKSSYLPLEKPDPCSEPHF